jgi:hypothetical protein
MRISLSLLAFGCFLAVGCGGSSDHHDMGSMPDLGMGSGGTGGTGGGGTGGAGSGGTSGAGMGGTGGAGMGGTGGAGTGGTGGAGTGGTGGATGGSGGTIPVDVHKVDVLFMIDNSPSMDAMQAELRNRFQSFLQPFQDLAKQGKYVDLQIGVVTSDYGAGATDGPLGAGCVHSPGGQKGLLQAKGVAAAASCKVPDGNVPFITYKFDPSGDVSNLPTGQDLITTFTCMASVGSKGCGFEHQLESVYAALHNTVENAGFVRADAQLAVVFLTNEDDGSAPPDTMIYSSTADVATYGAYDTYRQSRFGVACGAPLALMPYAASNGLLNGCVPAPNNAVEKLGSEYDVSRYIGMFTAAPTAGGIKSSADDVFLVGIDAPDDNVETILAQIGTGNGTPPNEAYQECKAIASDCLVRVQHSCQNTVTKSFFGDPSVRLNTVVRSVTNHQLSSICGDDLTKAPDYSKVLNQLATTLATRIK